MAETTEIRLPYRWTPRPYQLPLWNYLAAGGKRAVTCWPRRHGKDDVYMRHTSCAMGERKGNYWYLLPQYDQARKAMWDAIDEETGIRRIDAIFPEAIRTIYREKEMQIGYAGSLFQLVGADNYHSLVGSPPVGLVFSEFARTDPGAWAYLMPILERNGGWVGFNSTPFGHNHYEKLLQYALAEQAAGRDWFAEVLTAPELGVYGPEQLQKIHEQLMAIHGEEYGTSLYRQEYECSFDVAIPGSIWGDCVKAAEAAGRIRVFPIDPKAPTYCAYDLGRTDDTSIWWYQFHGREIHVIDQYASAGLDICNANRPEKSVVHILLSRRQTHGCPYAIHTLPHDARPRTQAAGGKSIYQQFLDAAKVYPELGIFRIGKRLDKQEHIQAARATFPFCTFHKTTCAKGLLSLAQYHREWDDETKCFRDTPMHDFSSHDADAFMELATSWTIPKGKAEVVSLTQALLASTVRNRTLTHIRNEHFAKRRAERAWSMT